MKMTLLKWNQNSCVIQILIVMILCYFFGDIFESLSPLVLPKSVLQAPLPPFISDMTNHEQGPLKKGYFVCMGRMILIPKSRAHASVLMYTTHDHAQTRSPIGICVAQTESVCM